MDKQQGKYDDVLRPFMALMETELHANSGKGDRPGWLSMTRQTALLEIYYHVAKLQKAAKDDDAALIREHAADVANMAMMLLDVCGGLPTLPQPPSASDERGRFEALYPMPPGCVRLSTGYAGSSYKAWETHHYMGKWEGWQARAALAPSPGVDAAEQWKEFAQHLECCRNCAEDSVGSCIEGEKLKAAAYAAPSPAASADEWMAEASRLAEMVLGISVRDPGVGQMVGINKAARKLLAHRKARP